jgi:hypothetical protein
MLFDITEELVTFLLYSDNDGIRKYGMRKSTDRTCEPLAINAERLNLECPAVKGLKDSPESSMSRLHAFASRSGSLA